MGLREVVSPLRAPFQLSILLIAYHFSIGMEHGIGYRDLKQRSRQPQHSYKGSQLDPLTHPVW